MSSDNGLPRRITESWQGYPIRPEFVELTVEEAERLAAASGLSPVRVLDLDNRGVFWTADRQLSRLHVVVKEGRVLLAASF